MDGASVVVGVSSHNGWAELVSVGVWDHAPMVADRRRVPLVDVGLPDNPYHHEGLVLAIDQATQLVGRVRLSVASRSREALGELHSTLSAVAVVIEESPFAKLPDDVSEVLASARLTYAADGMMYRESLVEAASTLGMKVVRFPRKVDVAGMAAERSGADRSRVEAWARAQSTLVGVPWRKEHQLVAMAALWELAADHQLNI